MTEHIKELYKYYQEHPVVITDSRKIESGCLFFALQGDNFNGNNFAEAALREGARLAVVDDEKFKGKKGFYFVDQVLETLQQLAAYHRSQLKTTIIAITGTNGKTTTKELIHSVLRQQYKVMATEGNLNNHIGVPLTLLSMPADLDFGIVEMGANHLGEIAALCEIAMPDFGLITNVGKAHLEGFGSLEGVLKAKTELYRYLVKKQGKVFVNKDDSVLWNRTSELERITYGKNPPVSCHGEINKDFPRIAVEITFDNKKHIANTNLIGAYNFENILAAACMGSYFGVDPDDIVKGIENFTPDNLRSQFVQTENNEILLDAYNANPSSMLAALNNFTLLEASGKMLILGEMLELGNDSELEHARIIEIAVQKNLADIWLVGSGYIKMAGKASHYFKTTEDLLTYVKKAKPRNKTILIKGSRGNKLEQIIPYL